MDAEQNFIYEVSCPADKAFELFLYGYPAIPEQATAVITKEGSAEPVAEIAWDGRSFSVPPLPIGRYRILASADGCTTEAVLRVGDSLFIERLWRFAERQINKIWPE